jgi:hypothetical protein
MGFMRKFKKVHMRNGEARKAYKIRKKEAKRGAHKALPSASGTLKIDTGDGTGTATRSVSRSSRGLGMAFRSGWRKKLKKKVSSRTRLGLKNREVA